MRGLGNNNNNNNNNNELIRVIIGLLLMLHSILDYFRMICIVTYCPLNLEYALSLGASFTSTDLSKLKELKVNLSHSSKGRLLLALNLKTLVKLNLSTLHDKWRQTSKRF